MATPRICSISGCGKSIQARGWCTKHYSRWNRHGDPLYEPPEKPKTTCSVTDCSQIAKIRGWCAKHYTKHLRRGTPLGVKTEAGKPMEYYRNVVLTYRGTDCCIWPFGTCRGYATLDTPDRSTRYVCRMICEDKYGPAPTANHQAAHSCGRGHEGCVNPNHLRWATRKENATDMLEHGSRLLGEKSHNAKLCRADVLKIRALRGQKTQREIAELFGVSEPTVCDIQLRNTWKHLR